MSDSAALGIVITIIGVVYNVPFTWRVWRTGSAKDIDPWFLLLRIVNSILTIAYGGILHDPYIITTNAIPLVSSLIVLIIRTKRVIKPAATDDETDDSLLLTAPSLAAGAVVSPGLQMTRNTQEDYSPNTDLFLSIPRPALHTSLAA